MTSLERNQRARLLALLELVLARNAFYGAKLRAAGFDVRDLARHREAETPLGELLALLPVTTKAELERDQELHPPYGSNLSYALERYVRLHQTSGTVSGTPLRWLDTAESWSWFIDCWTEVYKGMRLRADDRVFCAFSFGPFIGFWAGFEAALRLGNMALSGGGMTTPARLRFLLEHRATVVACTPTYALRLAEVASAEGLDLRSSPVRALIVAGEPGGSVAATRHAIEERWGARCFDHCGMTEAGAIGFEAIDRPGGLHVHESEFIVELFDPASGEPRPEGGEGELVVTNLGRLGSPLVRYRTGDLVRWVPENRGDDDAHSGWLEGGILGRLDDMVIVRGNNVYPSAIEAVVRRFDEVAEYRVRVRERRGMAELCVEVEPVDLARHGERLARRVAAAIKDAFLFTADVRSVPPGTLPRFELKAKRFIKETSGDEGRLRKSGA